MCKINIFIDIVQLQYLCYAIFIGTNLFMMVIRKEAKSQFIFSFDAVLKV